MKHIRQRVQAAKVHPSKYLLIQKKGSNQHKNEKRYKTTYTSVEVLFEL